MDSKVGCCLLSHVLKNPFALLYLDPCLLLTQQWKAGYRWGRESLYPHTTHIQPTYKVIGQAGYGDGNTWQSKQMSASASRCFHAGKNSQIKCHTFMMSHIHDVTIHDVTHPWCHNPWCENSDARFSSEEKEPLPPEWKCLWWKWIKIQQYGFLTAHRVVPLPPGMIAEAFWL